MREDAFDRPEPGIGDTQHADTEAWDEVLWPPVLSLADANAQNFKGGASGAANLEAIDGNAHLAGLVGEIVLNAGARIDDDANRQDS